MDLSRFHPVFLVLVWLQAVLCHVEPPTNVTLHCRSKHNLLTWSYDQLMPGLRFKVFIGSTSGLNGHPSELWVDPPALQADVSFLSKSDNDYYLEVFAVVGKNESEPSPQDGISFSYFKDSLSAQKCFVDLPPVNVTAPTNKTVKFSFMHPSLYLHMLKASPTAKPKKKRYDSLKNLPAFDYDVVIINERHHYGFSCEESVCEKMLPVVAPQEQYCLEIKGELEKMLVKGTQKYCAKQYEEIPSLSNNIVIIVVIVTIVVVLIVLALVLAMLYIKKTRPKTSLPRNISETNNNQHKQTLPPFEEHISEAEVDSPTPLLPATNYDFTPAGTPTTEDVFRMALGIFPRDDVCHTVEVGQPNGEGPGYMGGRSLEEDGTQNPSDYPSGYEKREKVVEVALGPGEQAEGYRG
uniref:Interferon gamma receptor 1-like n=1 Tax=Monopterus albus TaxID=43700 RepID=A0A3Q3KIT7_MONAL|nr:interferon gamma receptor 1-like precursor [Monopterus albus]